MSVAARVLCAAIVAYQTVLSPLLGRHCRFVPTCSEYTRLAILGHGVGHGIALGIWRLLRCHPLQPGGYDPPPPRRTQQA